MAGLLATSIRTADAQACSPEPEAFTVHSTFPLGAGAKLNGAIYVSLETADPSEAGEGYPVLSLVNASTEQAVTLNHGSSWHEDGRIVDSYGPASPLLANTTYRAEVAFESYSEDPEIDPRYTTWEFTTGEALLPALSSSGALRVTLEAGEEPIIDCSDADSCGDGCVEVGTQPATRAVVELPKLHGGEEAFGYEGELVVTRAVPAQPHSTGLYLDREGHEFVVGLSNASDQELSLILPDTTEAYRPCFAISARDASAQRIFPEPVCLTELVQPRPAPNANDDDDDGDQDVARPTGGGGGPGAAKESGCSLGGTGGSGVASLLTLALLAGLVARRRC